MSSTKLKKATRFVITRATERKKTSKKKKDSQARSDAEKEPGQFFVINKENEAAKIYKITGIRLTRKERRDLFAKLLSFLRRKERALRLDRETYLFLKSQKSKFKIKPGDAVFIVSNFEAAKRLKFKSKNKEDISKIQANFLNSLERVRKNVTAKELSLGSQIGHGERGIAASQFGVERAVTEAKEKFNLSDAEVTELRTIILRQRENYNLKVDVSHQQFISTSGKFNKKFSFVLSSQYFEKNKQEAQLEREALEQTLQDFEVLEQETSTKPIDAIEEVFGEMLAPKKAKVSGKRRKKINENAKGTVTKRKKNEKVTAYQGMRGVPVSRAVNVNKRKTTVASTPLRLIALLNQRLPDTIVNNMGSPALENRTGRFASSVKITDISRTTQGYPSIGYTYRKDPYQTFEPGYQQGSTELDPRKLINASIREIAAEFAIGRFYTRRV